MTRIAHRTVDRSAGTRSGAVRARLAELRDAADAHEGARADLSVDDAVVAVRAEELVDRIRALNTELRLLHQDLLDRESDGKRDDESGGRT